MKLEVHVLTPLLVPQLLSWNIDSVNLGFFRVFALRDLTIRAHAFTTATIRSKFLGIARGEDTLRRPKFFPLT